MRIFGQIFGECHDCKSDIFYLISVSAFAGDQKTMQEKAEQWFLKFQQASPEKQAKMLERRNFCLTLPEEERKKTCGKGHQK